MSHANVSSPTVVITGASTGIGGACALELDRRGFRVFAGVRSEAAAEKLQAKASARLTPVLIDVTDAASIAAAAKTGGRGRGRRRACRPGEQRRHRRSRPDGSSCPSTPSAGNWKST